MRPLLALLLMLGVVAPAAAQRPHGDGGWPELLHRERREGRQLTRQGLAFLVSAMAPLDSQLGDQPKWVLLERALLRFGRARRALPDDPELAYYTAYALTQWERPNAAGGTDLRAEEAIDAWHRLRAIAPEFLPDRVAYHLAMLHMRRQELPEARAEYRMALERASPAPVELAFRFYVPSRPEAALGALYAAIDRANLHGNFAEVLMLTGDVRAAEVHYRRAIELSGDDVFTRNLALWGLALALERAGDHDGALEHADRAIRESPLDPHDPRFRDAIRRHGEFAMLHLDFVFFEPAFEIHAYEALGHEAMASRAVDSHPASFEDALRSWRMYLAEGGVSTRFGAGARERVEALEATVEALPEEDRRPRRRGVDLLRVDPFP